ncbi:MAG: sulfotransferase domain-containing protein [Verrucomicrobiaceae bacterium]|nr:sulfotransferase domain-containing protein [Verrucomicrobiaceae bacterium]
MNHASSNIRLPDFIGIGAMRSGTSWLTKQLNRHPEIWTSSPKELHFFDRHFIDSQDDYARHFSGAPESMIAGEVTPAYAILESGRISVARSWMPDLKLLFIMRDPVERAWSHARKDFPQFHNKPVEEAKIDELHEFMKLPQVAMRGDYLGCLKTWLEYYNSSQLWCGFLEQAATDPEALLRELFIFLGVNPDKGIHPQLAAQPENTRPPSPIPEALRAYLSEQLYAQNSGLESLLGRPLPWN